MAEGIEGALSRKIGPLPVGGWVLLVGGAGVAAFMVSRNQQSDREARTIVDEVPVPVGGVAAPDGAPLVMSPVVRVDVEGLNELRDALTGNTSATKGLTDAQKAAANVIGKNTSAVSGNTSAIKKNTSALGANTKAVKSAPAPKAAPKPAPKAKSSSKAKTYTIKSGDTLWGIAKRYTGNGNNWNKLYAANRSVIDSTAKRRGKSGGGRWIFPGTRLTLPSGW